MLLVVLLDLMCRVHEPAVAVSTTSVKMAVHEIFVPEYVGDNGDCANRERVAPDWVEESTISRF